MEDRGTEQSKISCSSMLPCFIYLGEINEIKRSIVPRVQQGCSSFRRAVSSQGSSVQVFPENRENGQVRKGR